MAVTEESGTRAPAARDDERAGVGEVAGIHFRLRYPEGISPGYGFTAIIVAWLARLDPLGAVLTSFLLGGLLVGGDAIQVSPNLDMVVDAKYGDFPADARPAEEYLGDEHPALGVEVQQ